jgi:hypothetical protein
MYVSAHKDAASRTQILEDAGYTVKVLPQPVEKEEIRSAFLRRTVDRVGRSFPWLSIVGPLCHSSMSFCAIARSQSLVLSMSFTVVLRIQRIH